MTSILLGIAWLPLALSGSGSATSGAEAARARLSDTMSLAQIVETLGSDHVDIGSGLHVLRYLYPDSSRLLIGGPGMSSRPLYIDVVAPAQPSNTHPRPRKEPIQP